MINFQKAPTRTQVLCVKVQIWFSFCFCTHAAFSAQTPNSAKIRQCSILTLLLEFTNFKMETNGQLSHMEVPMQFKVCSGKY